MDTTKLTNTIIKKFGRCPFFHFNRYQCGRRQSILFPWKSVEIQRMLFCNLFIIFFANSLSWQSIRVHDLIINYNYSRFSTKSLDSQHPFYLWRFYGHKIKMLIKKGRNLHVWLWVYFVCRKIPGKYILENKEFSYFFSSVRLDSKKYFSKNILFRQTLWRQNT